MEKHHPAHVGRRRQLRAYTGHSQTAWRACQIDPKRKVVAVDSRSPIGRVKASEESGQLGLAACVRFGKHGFELGARSLTAHA